jgi:hypothetical protein
MFLPGVQLHGPDHCRAGRHHHRGCQGQWAGHRPDEKLSESRHYGGGDLRLRPLLPLAMLQVPSNQVGQGSEGEAGIFLRRPKHLREPGRGALEPLALEVQLKGPL